MSTRGAVVRALLAEAREALAHGRSHLIVIGDRETTRHLPPMFADALHDLFDPVTVPLAGSRDTVADCLAAAIREARQKAPDRPETAAANTKPLALFLPEALSIPTSALRSLHEIASLLGSHRLVLFVDRDSTPFPDPAEELISRIGVSIPKVELQEPTLRLQASPAPVPAGSPEPEPPVAEAPVAEVPAPDLPASAPAEANPSPNVDAEADTLPRFADPVVVAAPARADLEALRRSRRRARAWRWTALSAIVATCLSGLGAIRHAPAIPAFEAAPPQTELTARVPESASIAQVTPAMPLTPPPELEPIRSAAAEQPVPAAEPAPVSVSVPAPTKKKKTSPATARRDERPAAPPPVMLPVNFNADPWADLAIDGRKLGPTPIGNVRLSTGQHRVRATFPDGRVVERKIRVSETRRRFQIR